MPLPMRDDSTLVDVSLVEAAPSPQVVEAPPEPKAPPVPEPMLAPPPEAEPEQVAESAETPIPTPPRQTPKPPASMRQPAHARKATTSVRTSPASSSTGANLYGTASLARPSYRSNPRPEYPVEARRLHQQGLVLLSVEVGADGRPREVTLKRSSGVRSLDEAAMQAVRRWTFEPANVGGLPVTSRADVPVRFSLAE